jgi:hypothetical protein
MVDKIYSHTKSLQQIIVPIASISIRCAIVIIIIIDAQIGVHSCPIIIIVVDESLTFCDNRIRVNNR